MLLVIRNGCGNSLPPFWCWFSSHCRRGAEPVYRRHGQERSFLHLWRGLRSLGQLQERGKSSPRDHLLRGLHSRKEERTHQEIISQEAYSHFVRLAGAMPSLATQILYLSTTSCQVYGATASVLDLTIHSLCSQQKVSCSALLLPCFRSAYHRR